MAFMTIAKRPSAFLPLAMSLAVFALVLGRVAFYGRDSRGGRRHSRAPVPNPHRRAGSGCRILCRQVAATGTAQFAADPGTAGSGRSCSARAGLLLPSLIRAGPSPQPLSHRERGFQLRHRVVRHGGKETLQPDAAALQCRATKSACSGMSATARWISARRLPMNSWNCDGCSASARRW